MSATTGGLGDIPRARLLPSDMEAACSADAYGLVLGHDAEQADARQAYTQAELHGTPAWVRLPPDQWLVAWRGMRDPVCPLKLT
jgi:hypothetical protein